MSCRYAACARIALRGPGGWWLFAVVWSLALVGVVLKIDATGKYEKASLTIYLLMGWCAIIALQPLLTTLDRDGLALLAAGGLTYTGGVAFYVSHRLRFHHAIWHLFVLAGSVLHFFAVYYYVLPGPASTG